MVILDGGKRWLRQEPKKKKKKKNEKKERERSRNFKRR